MRMRWTTGKQNAFSQGCGRCGDIKTLPICFIRTVWCWLVHRGNLHVNIWPTYRRGNSTTLTYYHLLITTVNIKCVCVCVSINSEQNVCFLSCWVLLTPPVVWCWLVVHGGFIRALLQKAAACPVTRLMSAVRLNQKQWTVNWHMRKCCVNCRVRWCSVGSLRQVTPSHSTSEKDLSRGAQE